MDIHSDHFHSGGKLLSKNENREEWWKSKKKRRKEKKRGKGKNRGGKREEKRGIGVKEGNPLFVPLFNIGPYDCQKSPQKTGKNFKLRGLRLRLLVFFFERLRLQGAKKTAPDYWISLAKYSFPRKLVR